MAILRNLVLSLFRLAGISQVKRLTESIAADRMRILGLVMLTCGPITHTLPYEKPKIRTE